MRYVVMSKHPSGKTERRRALKKKERERERILYAAVGAVRYAIGGAGLCLPTCFVLRRFLERVMPSMTYTMKLGALNVRPLEGSADAIAFDPRGPDGIDGGFHAWLEDTGGAVLDPSIAVTLHAEGYDVDPGCYLLDGGRRFTRFGLEFWYEELGALELFGVEESEPQIVELLRMATTGEPAAPGVVHLDVRWGSKPYDETAHNDR